MDAGILTLQPGTVLDDRFEVLGVLGQGGFATVYRARQRNIDREVAIKLLGIRPGRSPEEVEKFTARFYMEAKRSASIKHPGIVTVFDHGVTGGGVPFMAMELLDGRTLDDEIEIGGAMEPRRALGLFVRCLDALDAAHRLKIVHKDLKPSNLFLTHPGSVVESLQILDFGISALADDDEERFTTTHQYVGTAAYCVPEYYEARRVSPQVDVYQMGLVLAEALMGRRVVNSPNAMRAIYAHCSGSLKLPWKLLQAPIGDLLARALSLKPEDRFRDAGEMRDALASIDPEGVPRLSLDDLAKSVPISKAPPRSEAEVFGDGGDDPDEVLFGLGAGSTATFGGEEAGTDETLGTDQTFSSVSGSSSARASILDTVDPLVERLEKMEPEALAKGPGSARSAGVSQGSAASPLLGLVEASFGEGASVTDTARVRRKGALTPVVGVLALALVAAGGAAFFLSSGEEKAGRVSSPSEAVAPDAGTPALRQEISPKAPERPATPDMTEVAQEPPEVAPSVVLSFEVEPGGAEVVSDALEGGRAKMQEGALDVTLLVDKTPPPWIFSFQKSGFEGLRVEIDQDVARKNRLSLRRARIEPDGSASAWGAIETVPMRNNAFPFRLVLPKEKSKKNRPGRKKPKKRDGSTWIVE